MSVYTAYHYHRQKMASGYGCDLPHGVLLPLLPLPPPCCPDVASVVLPPLPEGEISRDLAEALLVLPRLLVVAGVTLGHVFSFKPERAILKRYRSLSTSLFPITPEHNRTLSNKSPNHERNGRKPKPRIQVMSKNSFLDAVIIFFQSQFTNQVTKKYHSSDSQRVIIHAVLYYGNTSGFKTNDFVGHEGMFLVNS